MYHFFCSMSIVLHRKHVLAATAEGYACNLRIPLGDEDIHSRKVLGFPEDYLMPCLIGLGLPRKDAKMVEQKEVSIKERIHSNKW